MSVDRGAGCVRSPVSPVGAPASRNREGFTAASCRSVRRMVGEVNGWFCAACWCLESDVQGARLAASFDFGLGALSGSTQSSH